MPFIDYPFVIFFVQHIEIPNKIALPCLANSPLLQICFGISFYYCSFKQQASQASGAELSKMLSTVSKE